ncbi:MAG TPA: glycosyltransferase [Flavitalea sp.]|nr:glycosyltransferase [Flavitalea sp.]
MGKISVIIPNYNHAAFLQQRIESVLQQSYPNYELIILDDASTDGSREIIERYRDHPRISHILFNDSNSGSTFSQWQKGISLASGKYIWLAESDDYADPRFLEECINEFTRIKELELVYTDSMVVDDCNAIVHRDLSFWTNEISLTKWNSSYTNNGREEIVKALSRKNTIPNASAVVFKKKFFPEVLSYKYCGDWLFWIKILESGNMTFIKQPLNYFRTHGNTTRTQSLSPARLKLFLRERSLILSYLKMKQLIEQHSFRQLKKDIVDQWKTVYTISDILKKDFFLPFTDIRLAFTFLGHKLLNAFRRIIHVRPAA